MKTAFILLLLYFGEARTSMVAPEFNSKETCEAAKEAAKKEMNGTITLFGNRAVYAVCVEK